jgi:hypothetical protein
MFYPKPAECAVVASFIDAVLKDDSATVRVLVLQGLGPSGKTSLARALNTVLTEHAVPTIFLSADYVRMIGDCALRRLPPAKNRVGLLLEWTQGAAELSECLRTCVTAGIRSMVLSVYVDTPVSIDGVEDVSVTVLPLSPLPEDYLGAEAVPLLADTMRSLLARP